MMLIGVAGGAMNEGIGVGGFFVIMGLAFFINSLFDHPGDDYPPVPAAALAGPVRSRPNRLARTSATFRHDTARHPYRYTPLPPIKR